MHPDEPSTPLTPAEKLELQKKIGVFLFYAREKRDRTLSQLEPTHAAKEKQQAMRTSSPYHTSSSGAQQRIGYRTREITTKRYIDGLAQAEAAAVVIDD